MKIVLVSSLLSKKTQLLLSLYYQPLKGSAIQKFLRLLSLGIYKNGVEIQAVSYLPLNFKKTKKLRLSINNETEEGVHYNYIPLLNIPILRNLKNYFGIKSKLKKLLLGNEDSVILYDTINYTSSKAVLSFSKKHGIPAIGIVTDVQTKRPKTKRKDFLFNFFADRFGYNQLFKASGYIFITKQMNDLINHNHKPFCVVECFCDSSLIEIDNEVINKAKPRVIMYAGSCHKVYGIKNLIDGFLKANISNAVLVVYGVGDYVEEIIKISETNHSIVYGGVISSDELMQEEIKATLLVNPRSSEGDYTSYSFPSKNMEYISSGTPLLGVLLPGIPEEYSKYMFVLNDSTADGISDELVRILSLSDKEINNFGLNAKKFVVENKNNVYFGGQIINLCEKVLKKA